MMKKLLLKIYNMIVTIIDDIFDTFFLKGTDFGGFVNDNLPMNCVNYEGARLWAVSKRNIRNVPKSNILDIGCGKGKMLWHFKRIGFDHVAGVEYSTKLSQIARDNMKLLGISACIYNSDATLFENYDDYSVFYIYNSFEAEVMEKVVEKIRRSILEKPRDVVILYLNPRCVSIIECDGMFYLEKEYGSLYRRLTGLVLKIYKYKCEKK